MISLTTDFGVADGYVGIVKGVILSIAPAVRLVDLSHQVPPQDVRRAAFLLDAAAPFFPPDTVHLAVVDPGVGTARRAVVLRTPQGLFVGPDNGLFTCVLAEVLEWEMVELANPAYRLPQLGATFHGRDLFAPAAAHLASGVPLAAFGPPVSEPCRFSLPCLQVEADRVLGEVLYADHFGNLITSVGRLHWQGDDLALSPAFRPAGETRRIAVDALRLQCAGHVIQRVCRTYGEVGIGDLLALVGSMGFLEIAVRQGSAEQTLGVRPGERVEIEL
ncbi:MAG: SAM-dependent chlorinase/fluorinase [Anaerolineae bacterium]|nr:SAM-dependent chlorinase/fluorinase [Anaerolineae bacterium]